jgi:hypothetical protein
MSTPEAMHICLFFSTILLQKSQARPLKSKQRRGGGYSQTTPQVP